MEDAEDPNFKVLYLLVGVGFILFGTTLTTGCFYLQGIWFNSFNNLGLVQKYKKHNFHLTSRALAHLPIFLGLLYFATAIFSVGKHTYIILMNSAMLFFMLPFIVWVFSVLIMEARNKKVRVRK